MLRPTWFLLVAALAASPAAAAPGDDDGRGGGFDHDHALRAVALGLAGAELTAELTFAVRTTGPEVIALDLGLGLPLPADATVTAVTLADGVTRRAGTRTAASTADASVAAIDDAAPAPRRQGYVLVSANEARQVSVRLGLPSAGRRTLTLQVHAPTCVLDERRWAQVPTAWAPRLRGAAGARQASTAEVAQLRAACLGSSDGRDHAGDGAHDRVWLGLPDPALRRLQPRPARVQVRAEQFGDDDHHQLARVELALGRALTPMPVAPHVVVLLDASRSLDDGDWDVQRALVDAFLARAPHGTRVAVLAYTRTTRPVVAGWVEAGAARRALRRPLATLVRGNGSEVSAAVAEAARLLAAVQGERRVLLVSDQLLRLREQGRAAELHQLLPAGVRLIAVDVRGGELLTRHDESRFAAAAAATGGIAMTSEDRPAQAEPAPFDATALWRPTSLDRISVGAAAWTELAPPSGPAACAGLRRGDDAAFDLAEGTGCSWWATSPARAAGPIQVRGLLWNQPWTGGATAVASAALARQLGPTPPRPDLAAMWRRAAEAGGHVGPAWSLLVTWGSGGGYQDTPSIMGGSICDCGGPGDVGFGRGQGRPPRPLEPLLRAAVARCLVSGVGLEIALETTRSEIVAVEVTARGADPTGRRAGVDVATCAEAAIWDTPFEFDGADHAASTFTIQAPR